MTPSFEHRLLNLAQTALLLLGMAGLAAFAVSAIAGVAATLVAVAALVIGVVVAQTAPKRLVLASYGARRVSDRAFPEAAALLRELADRAGLPTVPALYYLPSAAPNAFAVGDHRDSAVCVSDGLLRLLNRREFTGVLAHEVSHIAHRDLWIMGLADMMTRFTSLLSTLGQVALVICLPLILFSAVSIPWMALIVLIFAPTAMSLLQLALSRTREFDADRGGAMLTGDPMALASALAKLERRRGRFWEEILLPGRRMPEPSLLRTHPPTAQRIERLRTLAAAAPQPRAAVLEPVRLEPGASVIPSGFVRVTRRPRLFWTGAWR